MIRLFSKFGYDHKTVNHTENLKDPVTGVHTNTIEGLWAHVERLLIGGGTTKRNLYGYLATYMLRRRLNTQIEEDPFVKFINLANEWSVGWVEKTKYMNYITVKSN